MSALATMNEISAVVATIARIMMIAAVKTETHWLVTVTWPVLAARPVTWWLGAMAIVTWPAPTERPAMC